MVKSGSGKAPPMQSPHQRPTQNGTSVIQITAFDPGGCRGKITEGAETAAAKAEASGGADTAKTDDTAETEEETSCFTTSQSVVITQCADGETKHMEREVVEHTKASKTSAIQACELENLIQGRTREKYELQRLNDRLSSFIERVRLLEAHNRSLAKEATSLRSNYSGDINRLRGVYNADLEQLKASLAASEERCVHCEIRLRRSEVELSKTQQELCVKEKQLACGQEQVQLLTEKLRKAEKEAQEIQQRCTMMAEERAKETSDYKRLQEHLKDVYLENDKLSIARHTAETDAKVLREELAHRKKVQEAELRELSNLVQRESTQEALAIFRTEIMQVLREIQVEYEQRLECAKADLCSAYETKVHILRHSGGGALTGAASDAPQAHLRGLLSEQRQLVSGLEEAKAQLEARLREALAAGVERERAEEAARRRLTVELSSTQAELLRLRTDFEALLDSKTGLEIEIAAYRRLIEHEERRCNLTDFLGHSKDRPLAELLPPEPTLKRISHTRSSKGNISIIECAVDGTSVTLANTGSKREDISGMRLVRQVDNHLTNSFTIPKDTVLETDSSSRLIKIWSEGCKPVDSVGFELPDSRWGIGTTTRTILIAPGGEEKAAYTLRVMSPPNLSERSLSNCGQLSSM